MFQRYGNIEEMVNRELIKVLSFYESKGISLSHFPRVECVDAIYYPSPTALMRANVKDVLYIKAIEELSFGLFKYIFHRDYGLEVSREEFYELWKSVGECKEENIRNITQKEKAPDIMVFVPELCNFIKGGGNIAPVIAHEVWHLVEIDRGVFYTYPLIIEGTATDVVSKYEGNTDYLENSYFCTTVDNFFREGIAHIIGHMFWEIRDSFSLLLDTGIRARIQEEALNFIIPKLADLIMHDNKKGISGFGTKPLPIKPKQIMKNCSR